MYKSRFNIYIKSDGKNEVKGIIKEYKQVINASIESIEFEPLIFESSFSTTIILGDIVQMDKKVMPLSDMTSRNIKIIDGKFVVTHQFIKDYSFCNDNPIKIFDVISYIKTIEELKLILQNEKHITIEELKEYNPFLKYRCEISQIIPNPLCEKFKKIKNKEDRKQVDEKSFNRKEKHEIMYICESMGEVVAAILHYFLLCKYTFYKCHHCDNFFVRKTEHFKNCTRNSPYHGFTHLSCEKAVRNIRQRQSRKKCTISDELGVGSKADIDFYNKCALYEDKILNEGATVENLLAYDKFLGIPKVK